MGWMIEWNDELMVDEALIREGDAWVLLMTSGAATHADADALRAWRRRSPAHEQAFREAVRLRDAVRAVAAAERAGPEPSVISLSAHRKPRQTDLDRRALLTGAVAASAAGVAVFAGGRMAGIWGLEPADFATAKGERRTIALADGVSAELNTMTRMARRPEVGVNGLELLDGEVLLAAALPADAAPLVALAADGRAIARQARFILRCDDTDVSVTCLSGEVLVEVGGKRHRVGAEQRLSYSGSTIHTLERVDTDVATAWRRGELVFRQEPLRNVIAEVNRYRPGRIVIASAALRERRINGTFFLGQLDEVIEQVRAGLGARVTRLPGDVVVLA